MVQHSKTSYSKLSHEDNCDVEANSVVGIPASSDSYPLKPSRTVLRKKSRSCCMIFCYVILALVALWFLLIAAAVTGGYMWTRRQVKRYTVKDGLDLPIHEIPQAELEIVKDRSKLFFDTIQSGLVPDEDLTITKDELNGFIARSDYLRGNAYVTIGDGNDGDDDDDKTVSSFLKLELSLPVDGLPGGRGRYFVATGRFEVNPESKNDGKTGALVTTELDTAVSDGPLLTGDLFMYWETMPDHHKRYFHELVVNVLRGEFRGKEIPQDFIDRKENLVHKLYEDEHDDDDDFDVVAFLDAIESVSFRNGAITVRARRSDSEDEDRVSLPDFSTKPTSTSSKLSWSNHGTRQLKATLSNWLL